MPNRSIVPAAVVMIAAVALCVPVAAVPQVDANPLAVQHYNAGVAFSHAGRSNAAVDEYRKAIHIDPNFAEAHANLGLALEGSDKDAAIQQLRTATRLKPGLAEAHNSLGALLYREQQYPAAANEYRTVLRLQPDSVAGHYNLGLALVKMRQTQAAITEFRAIRRLQPGFTEVRLDLGEALYETDDKADARAEWRAVAASGDADAQRSARRLLAVHR